MLIVRLSALTALIFPSLVLSQPTSGMLVGKVDGDPMRYECSNADPDGKIKCDFVQVLLSRVEKAEDLRKSLATIPELVADKDGEFFALCGEIATKARDALGRFERGEALDDGTIPPIEPEELIYFQRFVVALDNMCQDRSAENVEAFLIITHEKASHTCRPFINKYSQTFVKVSEKLWVVESSPSGDCGIVQTSRFTMPADGYNLLWEYTAQKVITNKSGITDLGIACSGFDEGAAIYTWKGGAQRVDCVYID